MLGLNETSEITCENYKVGSVLIKKVCLKRPLDGPRLAGQILRRFLASA